VTVQGKFEKFGLQVEEEEVMTNFPIHDGGKLLGEQSPTIHHSWELQVAKINGEARGYQEHFGVGREAYIETIG
jgi:hypothetical protein